LIDKTPPLQMDATARKMEQFLVFYKRGIVRPPSTMMTCPVE
jgi:hypothetical protein